MVFLKGVLIGLLFGIPVGAVGAMTVQRVLSHGVRQGILTGMGSSIADCIYAMVGTFGFTMVSDWLFQYQAVVNAVGSVLLIFMGIMMVYKKPQWNGERKEGILKNFLSSFAVGITNPATVLTFLFAFSYFGIAGDMSVAEGIFLVLGVAIGTMTWWILLSVFVGIFRKRVTEKRMRILNIIFGCIVVIFGISIPVKMLFMKSFRVIFS